MARHFIGLFLLIVATLAAVAWVEDRLFPDRSLAEAQEHTLRVAAALLHDSLGEAPADHARDAVAALATRSGAGLEMLSNADIAGGETLQRLRGGAIERLDGNGGESWMLLRFDADHVLSLRYKADPRDGRNWFLTVLFYAAIALILMLAIWPLARDLRVLEGAAANYGNRNWQFHMPIKRHSQIYRVAQTFRAMATRIDQLIASHKDMSYALSHEIKTPLSRMQFELEFAESANASKQVEESLAHLREDVFAINRLITATLEYAILERAEIELNLAAHDLTHIVPAIAESVKRDARCAVPIRCEVEPAAQAVRCDMHLMESALKNLLYNASRYARSGILVHFVSDGGVNRLSVEDDGPGIPEREWRRVFDSFVRLDRSAANKSGFGLGLAIVKRIAEWHGGDVLLSRSALGGARFCLSWPANLGRPLS